MLLKITTILLIMQIYLLADMGKLTKIVDGDTIYFNKVKCRIASIDTPESKRNKKAKRDVQQCKGVTLESMVSAGKLSTKHAKSLLKVGKSYHYSVIGKDRYKRSICVVDLNNRETFNNQMISDGYAVAFWKYIPKSQLRHFKQLSQQAKREKRGLYLQYSSVIKCLDNK